MDSHDTLHNHIHNHMDAYMDVLNSVKVSAMTHESQDIWREINERASAISVHEKVIDDVESSLQ
jgi:hypothetical protein